jgi:prepilin signal peptidase PulO-like enzyme (type II secretory pathway)
MPQITDLAMIAIVSLLCLVQIPIDIRTRRLSRSASITATAVAAMLLLIIAVVERSLGVIVVPVLVTLSVVSLYWLLHTWSPKSLGFGDVLLVVPLTLALARLAVDQVILWQFLASMSGAIHAVMCRIRSQSNTIPFGPHLLMSAWLVLVFSV